MVSVLYSGREVWVRDLHGSLCCVLKQALFLHGVSLQPREDTGGRSGKPDGGQAFHPVENILILLATSCNGNQDKRQLGGLLASSTDLTKYK